MRSPIEPLRWVFGTVLLMRLLFPFFDSPFEHIYSDPERHWNNGLHFLAPTVMGGQDPFLYQLWMYLIQQLSFRNTSIICLFTGMLCALMPLGWYRALKELLPKPWACFGAIVIGLMPEFIGIYAYFMNETLLLTLTGFAAWLTLRARRKETLPAFALACTLWLLAGFARSFALPMGAAAMGYLWLVQPRKLAGAAIGIVLLTAIMVPAGLHAQRALNFFAPFGNFYLNDAYRASGRKEIAINYTRESFYYRIGCPSFYNPTFAPFSDWTTGREGLIVLDIDTGNGRADWIAAKERASRDNTFPFWTDVLENLVYLTIGQAWPDSGRPGPTGWLILWGRWLWPLLIIAVAAGSALRVFRGREWLLPGLGLGMFLFLVVQHDAIMEARFREPIDPFFVASVVVMANRWRTGRKYLRGKDFSGEI